MLTRLGKICPKSVVLPKRSLKQWEHKEPTTFDGAVATVGFPDIALQGFAPKLAKGEIASLAGAADDPRYFQIRTVSELKFHNIGMIKGIQDDFGNGVLTF